MNRWELTDEVRNKYKPIIEEFLIKVRDLTPKQIELMDNEEFTLELSDTELRPYTLQELMSKEFGYTDSEFDDNGCELDFWITMSQPNSQYEKICINGCGMTFELTQSKSNKFEVVGNMYLNEEIKYEKSI